MFMIEREREKEGEEAEARLTANVLSSPDSAGPSTR